MFSGWRSPFTAQTQRSSFKTQGHSTSIRKPDLKPHLMPGTLTCSFSLKRMRMYNRQMHWCREFAATLCLGLGVTLGNILILPAEVPIHTYFWGPQNNNPDESTSPMYAATISGSFISDSRDPKPQIPPPKKQKQT